MHQTNSKQTDISSRFLPVERVDNLASSVDSFYQSPDFSQFMTSSGPDPDDNESDSFSPLFFQKLYVEDSGKRRRAAENCISALSRNFYTSEFNLVRAHLSRVVELSVECPFEDTRNIFSHFLKEYQKELQERNLVVPRYCDAVTYFFPSSETLEDIDTDIDTNCENTKEVFIEQFISTGRVNHLTRIMAWHPDFFYKYQSCNEYLMGNHEFTLPTHIKHFVALMAVSRWKNTYLVKQEERILQENGDHEWTGGFGNLPKKMNLLLEFNAKMAELPWKLTDADISSLVQGEDSWTVSEIVQLVIILATYRGLASFVSATGLNEELDYSDIPLKLSTGGKKPIIEDKNKMMLDKMRLNLTSPKQNSPLEKEEKGKQSTETDKLALFCAAATDEVQTNIHINTSSWTQKLEKKYGSHSNISYSDFNFKDSKPIVIQEYNWSTNGYNEVANYYSREMADILEDTFTFTMNFTYSNFNTEKSVDTTQFRLALWNYTHRLLGIFHDDYDYELVNIWLLKPLKQYIKKIVCYPFTITEADINELGFLLPSERVHVAFIVMEARREAELICVLRLVTRFTQSADIAKSLSNSSSSGGENLSDSRSKKSDIFFRIQ